jgi:hypothetical protein
MYRRLPLYEVGGEIAIPETVGPVITAAAIATVPPRSPRLDITDRQIIGAEIRPSSRGQRVQPLFGQNQYKQ